MPITFIIIIIILLLIFLFRKRILIQKDNSRFDVTFVTIRFIFTIKQEGYVDSSSEKPDMIIEYTGLYGKLYKSNYIKRIFDNYSKLEETKYLKSYNENNEYEKATYQNRLIIERKKGLKKGIEIEKYEYDKNNRLIRKYKIFDGKEIELRHFEYDDKNRIITKKEFLKGKQNRITKIELTKNNALIKSNLSRDWVKATEFKNNKLSSVYYYNNGKKEKWEFYSLGELWSTTTYDPNTGEEISKTNHIKPPE
jgi:hypothetical protein